MASTVDRVFSFHEADPGLILGILYVPQTLPGVTAELTKVWPQIT